MSDLVATTYFFLKKHNNPAIKSCYDFMKRNYTGKIGERLKFLSRCLERRDFRYALNLKGQDLRYDSTISGEFKFGAPFTLAFLAGKNDF